MYYKLIACSITPFLAYQGYKNQGYVRGFLNPTYKWNSIDICFIPINASYLKLQQYTRRIIKDDLLQHIHKHQIRQIIIKSYTGTTCYEESIYCLSKENGLYPNTECRLMLIKRNTRNPMIQRNIFPLTPYPCIIGHRMKPDSEFTKPILYQSLIKRYPNPIISGNFIQYLRYR